MRKWWDGLSPAEKGGLGVAIGVGIVATGGALAYAIGTGGVVIATPTVTILIGAATSHLRRAA